MKFYTCIVIFLFSFSIYAQNPELAKKYLDEGNLNKAIYEYELLYKQAPYNENYFQALIKAYQSAEKYDISGKLIEAKMKKTRTNKPYLWVYLGYNYQLQKDSIKARKYYDKAIHAAIKKPFFIYSVGNAFMKHYLLDDALKVYETAVQKDNNSNHFYQIAQIYAEKNMLEQMFVAYLEIIKRNPKSDARVKYYFARYISQDVANEANQILKDLLINEIKLNPQPQWYRLLHWLYVQQKEYKKAFLQLKSLYRQEQAGISEIYHLANTAKYSKKYDEAKRIYKFVVKEDKTQIFSELSKLALLKIDTRNLLSKTRKQEIMQQFETYIKEEWSQRNKISLQLQYADFLAFHFNQSEKALSILKNLSKINMPKRQRALLKMKQADILLYKNQFNQALILYTQVQQDFPNNELSYKATYDIARASFFQGDVEWAHDQLKAVKSIASDLIANDALDLDLVIINNKEQGDTLHTGLKKLARAKFEIFRKNPEKAIQILDSINREFKGQLIQDDALWLQAKIYEQQQKFDSAMKNYQMIMSIETENFFKDDALFRMAYISENKLGDEETAKKLYKKIIMEYPGSFWFTDARVRFRKLRGDNPENIQN